MLGLYILGDRQMIHGVRPLVTYSSYHEVLVTSHGSEHVRLNYMVNGLTSMVSGLTSI